MKKEKNIAELVIYGLLVILTFIPGFFKCSDWVDKELYSPNLGRYTQVQTLKSEEMCSFLEGMGAPDVFLIFGIVFYAGVIAGIVLSSLQLCSSYVKYDSKLPLFVSAVNMLAFAICAFAIETYDYRIFNTDSLFSLNVVFVIMLVMVIALLVISVFSYFKNRRTVNF